MKEVRQINELRRAFTQASMIAEGEQESDGGEEEEEEPTKKQSTTSDSTSSSSSSAAAASAEGVDHRANGYTHASEASQQQQTTMHGNANDPNTPSQSRNETAQNADNNKNSSTASSPGFASTNIEAGQQTAGNVNNNNNSSGQQSSHKQKSPVPMKLKKADLDRIAEDHFPPELRSYDGARTCMGWTYYEFLESLNTATYGVLSDASSQSIQRST